MKWQGMTHSDSGGHSISCLVFNLHHFFHPNPHWPTLKHSAVLPLPWHFYLVSPYAFLSFFLSVSLSFLNRSPSFSSRAGDVSGKWTTQLNTWVWLSVMWEAAMLHQTRNWSWWEDDWHVQLHCGIFIMSWMQLRVHGVCAIENYEWCTGEMM